MSVSSGQWTSELTCCARHISRNVSAWLFSAVAGPLIRRTGNDSWQGRIMLIYAESAQYYARQRETGMRMRRYLIISLAGSRCSLVHDWYSFSSRCVGTRPRRPQLRRTAGFCWSNRQKKMKTNVIIVHVPHPRRKIQPQNVDRMLTFSK